MADLLDSAQVQIKIGSYGMAGVAALSDPRLLQQVQAYRRQSGARMMALDKVGMHKRIPKANFHISRKIDGEFNVLIWDGKQALTLNPGGTVRVGLPVLDETARLLKAAKIKQAIIPGELFYARDDDKRPRVHDVSRVARSPESAADLERLHFAVFDIIELNRKPPAADYDSVWNEIKKLFGKGEKITPVETTIGDLDAIKEHFESMVESEGAEGVVARSDEAGSFKIKPRHSIDAVVIGFAEGTDDRSGMLHDLLLAIMRRDGSFHILGRVGGGFTDDQRVQFLSDLQDRVVESEYAEINSDHVAYQMVEPEWVIELSCLDFIAETTRGGTIDRMVLQWNGKAKTWETVRRMPLVSVISPQFVRIRDDKQVKVDDLRIEQLTDHVPIPMSDKTAEDLVLPKARILKRKVMIKEAKGKTMVRKLLLWKTNKEEQSREWPAYVLHLTDFSPNRKTPLDREIRVSHLKEQIQEHWDALAEKSFVRGWKDPE